MGTAEGILAAIRANGSDARDLRDAVHEAHHALQVGVRRGQWTREAISRAVKRMGSARAAASEIEARAVEQVVCGRFGVSIRPLKERMFTACLEAMKFREPFFKYEESVAAVECLLGSKRIQQLADRIVSLDSNE